ncbi:MAG: signal peptide peptidase SppA [Deferribacteraceae bacterium]|jgi:protease-4|nr:signal peptide peptidase SppA [Deferribacteraceae bacterium]
MKIIKKVFQGLIVLLMVALFARGVMFIFAVRPVQVSLSDKTDKIAILNIFGVIYEADSIIKKFEELEDDSHVKGYILRINSPGGLVTPSQQIYEYLLTVKKPLYVAMGSVAASGGYMTALPGNRIYAMPSTVTGSIGVIMQVPNYASLYEKIGISEKVIKSGKFKDAGNGSRPMTAEEERVLSDVVMDMYDQFVQAVSSRRNMSVENTKMLADGRIYTGRMAKENGLVDRIGSWQDVFLEMKQELGIPDLTYIEIEEESLSYWKKLFSKINVYFTDINAYMPRPPGFYYMVNL